MTDTTQYDELFVKNATKNIPWQLLKAQVKAESAFNPTASSPVGARGLAQFMPRTWVEWGKGGNIESPKDSINAQARYMDFLYKFMKKVLPPDSEFTLHWTLASYNWGMGNCKKLITSGSPHYPTVEKCMPKETSSYVTKILKFYKEYTNG